MRDYLIIIESGKHNYSAYAPDLPGCVATLEEREPVPEPTSIAERVQVSV